MSAALAIFAKRPIPGQVKTRLTPFLSGEDAASLYWAMVQDTWATASQLPGIEPLLFVDQPWQGFNDLAGGRSIEIQTSGHLGTRMYTCLELLRSRSFKCNIIIGTDSPTLPAAHIEAAFTLLRDDNDAVLGPAEDGGYYLVGCRRPHPAMFDGVAWSSPEAFTQTRSAMHAQGYRTHLTPLWRDVDSIDDVRWLANQPAGPAVHAWLAHNPL